MLRISKTMNTKINNPETFFNEHVKRFRTKTKDMEQILWNMELTSYLGDNVIQTRYGRGLLTDLKVATKLALCLTSYPALTFSDWGCSDKDMELILNLPAGTLYLARTKPFKYYFTIKATTDAHELLMSSTDLNVYLLTGGV